MFRLSGSSNERTQPPATGRHLQGGHVMHQGIPWDLRRRGLKDSRRHDERVREAVRKNLKHLIVEETIISSNGKRTVKVPVRYLDQYRFRYGREDQAEGVGHGDGEPGDVIARKRARGDGAGAGPEAGDQPGEEVYEAEIAVEEIAQMMLEDLNLPLLQETGADHLEADGLRFDDVRRRGIMTNLDKRRTLLENLKRQAARGQSKLGDFDDRDLRFKVWNIRKRPTARAAVYMLMDRSASMTTDKKYIAKSFYFWLTRFLKMKYHDVDLVFISHDVEAQVVSETDFFQIAGSGGTRCSSAYHLALQHMREFHPPSKWNVYAFHFSDGENLPSDNQRLGELVDELVETCRMVGYGEVLYGSWASFYGRSASKSDQRPLSQLHSELLKREASNLVLVCIDSREQIYGALRQFLAGEGTA